MTWVQIHFLGRIRIKVKRILHKKNPNLVPIAHKMVRCDETFEDDNPVRILCSLNEKVCQGRDRDVTLICTVQ